MGKERKKEKRKTKDEINEMRMKADALMSHLEEQEVKVMGWEMICGGRESQGMDWAGVKKMKQNKL